MGVVLAEVEKAVDTAIDSSREFLRDDVPLVVGVDVEEVALIVGIGALEALEALNADLQMVMFV